MTKGLVLKQKLGLDNFENCMIQKIINFPIPFFIITIDSKYPNKYMTYSRLKSIDSTKLIKLKYRPDTLLQNMDFSEVKLKLTPPLNIDEFNASIITGSILMIRDLAGEYYRRDNMFESIGSEFREYGKV